MSIVVFPFQFLHPDAGGNYFETRITLDEFERSQGGRAAVVARATHRLFAVTPSILLLPDNAGNDPSDFWNFWDDRTGRVDTFLFKAQYAHNRQITGESLGTAAGGGGEQFFLDLKHIDAATLVVKSAGVVQTLTTDYTFAGNNTAPAITTTATFDPGAVTADYEFYMPVRFTMAEPDGETVRYGGGVNLAAQEYVRLVVAMEEDRPGARYA